MILKAKSLYLTNNKFNIMILLIIVDEISDLEYFNPPLLTSVLMTSFHIQYEQSVQLHVKNNTTLYYCSLRSYTHNMI